MILLKANQELKLTFEKLIETMKAPVKWTGIFAVTDDYMILLGQVRSLFFHFDSRRVHTNIIEITVKEDEVWEILNNTRVRNSINMILYAFGKWGTIGGLRVDKDYAQLNRLFRNIMGEIGIRIEYTKEHFRFYKDGIRITYEDVIQAALEEPKEVVIEEKEPESRGLWHKLIWKKTAVTFSRVETTWMERIKSRIGNNFYMVGYLCPECKKKLHMAVYPMEREFRIETEEGGVMMARVCACDQCNCFYTPRPKRLLMEGDVYLMPFGEDRKAYEDYQELLGRNAQRVSNSHFNEYADRRKKRREEEESLEELYRNIELLSEEELEDVQSRMDESFYPDEMTKKYEKKVRDHVRKMKKERVKQQKKGATSYKIEKDSVQQEHRTGDHRETEMDLDEQRKKRVRSTVPRKLMPKEAPAQKIQKQDRKKEEIFEDRRNADEKERSVSSLQSEKYKARLNVLDRLSDRQMGELQKQIESDSSLLPDEKEDFIGRMKAKKQKQRVAHFKKKVDDCEDKPYAVTKKVQTQVQEEELPSEEKESLLDKLSRLLRRQGEKEVRQLMEQRPRNMDREEHLRFRERLSAYEEVDLSPYEEELTAGEEEAERREVAHIVKSARKKSREDYALLAERLREGRYKPDLVRPYLEQIRDKLRQIDQAAIDQILNNAAADLSDMSFAAGKEAYDSISQGEFLPELKIDALKMLEKRLEKIKADESELLVKKFQTECKVAGIAENARHYFYPARKVLLGETREDETKVIDYAMDTYAVDHGQFEYPVLVVDTSRNGSGKEGMILTPDHLYYSTLLSAYGMNITSIDKVTASTGLLNKGLYVYQSNGTKTKIPYAVDTKELPLFADVLDGFVRYLKEKPQSREVSYLAQEKHEKICCFRCGTTYKGGAVCPKCGYKNNV